MTRIVTVLEDQSTTNPEARSSKTKLIVCRKLSEPRSPDSARDHEVYEQIAAGHEEESSRQPHVARAPFRFIECLTSVHMYKSEAFQKMCNLAMRSYFFM